MQITPMTITVRELTENYIDDGDGDVIAIVEGYLLRIYGRILIRKAGL